MKIWASAPSAAVAANARLTITNMESGVSVTATTDEVGLNRVGPLNPDSYRVPVDMDRFLFLERRSLIVQVSQTLQLDLELTVCSPSATVSLPASTPLLES